MTTFSIPLDAILGFGTPAAFVALVCIFGAVSDFKNAESDSERAYNASILRWSIVAFVASPLALAWIPLLTVFLIGYLIWDRRVDIKEALWDRGVGVIWKMIWFKEPA